MGIRNLATFIILHTSQQYSLFVVERGSFLLLEQYEPGYCQNVIFIYNPSLKMRYMNQPGETEVIIVDTSLRDGLQGVKASQDVAANAMRFVPHYLREMKEGGITQFDAVSSANPARVPVMGAYPSWLKDVEAGVMNSANIQALVFNGNKEAMQLLEQFVRVGRIKSFAFVHSHDPDFLWANSNIRKTAGG